MSFKQAFVCDGCGREAPAEDGARHTEHKTGELQSWLHLDHMGSNRHILHFCSKPCVGYWARGEKAPRARTAEQDLQGTSPHA